ncbi:MAG: hypothetical protein ATN35_04955 [Epulopiscium sp. Nele67-Bin004]|nr:MAG: hypothetical protein ATN35_04955 [Epulopiscium sp. Nele67-Bin004]
MSCIKVIAILLILFQAVYLSVYYPTIVLANQTIKKNIGQTAEEFEVLLDISEQLALYENKLENLEIELYSVANLLPKDIGIASQTNDIITICKNYEVVNINPVNTVEMDNAIIEREYVLYLKGNISDALNLLEDIKLIYPMSNLKYISWSSDKNEVGANILVYTSEN